MTQILKTIPSPSSSWIFNIAGFATSFASASGTFEYMIKETNDLPMAIIFSVVLGVFIFACWDVVFNKKGWKKVAALLFAVCFSSISGFTIYQNNIDIASAPEQKKTEIIINDNNESIKSQIRSNESQIVFLQELNKTDIALINIIQGKVNRGISSRANNKKIRALKDDVTNRNLDIRDYQNTNTSLLGKKIEVLSPAPSDNLIVDMAMLIRAALYDFLTAISLLLKGWYRKEEEKQPTATAKVTGEMKDKKKNRQASVMNGSKKKALPKPKKPLPLVNSRHDSTDPVYLLINRVVEANEDGFVTRVEFASRAGITEKKAKPILEKAYEDGIMGRKKSGRGWAYFYAHNDNKIVKFRG